MISLSFLFLVPMKLWLIFFSVLLGLVSMAEPLTYSMALASSIDLVSIMPSNISNESAIARLFTETKILPEWFSSGFLAQIPISQIKQIISSIKTELGTYQSIVAKESDYIITFSKGKISSKIMLDDDGKIAYLLFTPVAEEVSLEEATARFKKLPGKVAFLVTENDAEIAALNADEPLAVASTFKLAVLAVLQRQIAAKKRSWGDVVALKASWKSLPSGMLQEWADGSLITLETLATLMISISDNTATDALIDILGRENIETLSPRNIPFLTTRENFALKTSNNTSLAQQYTKGSISERRAILDRIDRTNIPDLKEFLSSKVKTEIEWFFTTKELCNLMKEVAHLPLMSINPGLGITEPKDWSKVAFKGGSEPGVYQLTTWLKAKMGKTYCVSATWNRDTAIDEAKFVELYKGVITFLKGRK